MKDLLRTKAVLPRVRAGGGHLFVLFAAVLWGTTGTAQHFAPPGATPTTIGALRLVVGGTALLFLVRGKSRLRWHPALLAAAVGVAAYQAAFFAGVSRTGVAVGTLVTIGSAPVWAGLLEMLFLRHKPSRRWLWATMAAVVGSALLVGSGGELGIDGAGVGLTLAAGFSFALYTVASKSLLRHFSGDVVTAAALFGGGLLLLPLLLFGDIRWLWHLPGVVTVLHLGLVATAAAYLLFGRGLASISAASATTLTLAEPLTASLLGVTLLGERLSFVAILGAALVFLGLALLAVGGSGDDHAAEGDASRAGSDAGPD